MSEHAARAIEIQVLRYRPGRDIEPVWQSYQVPFTDDMSVLQALQTIKDDFDGSLSFRWSCRMAICGSCGMMINGRPELSCRTFLRDLMPGPVRLEALAHLPIERDLIVDVDPFLHKLESVKPWIVEDRKRSSPDRETLQTPEQLEQFEQFSGCINCLLCYAACPQFGLSPDFLGPGAIALAHRYNSDSRDAGTLDRMDALASSDGVWNCTAVGYCSEVCPKGVDPAHAVNQNKARAATHYALGALASKRHQEPEGSR